MSPSAFVAPSKLSSNLLRAFSASLARQVVFNQLGERQRERSLPPPFAQDREGKGKGLGGGGDMAFKEH